jgi:hypothetical protein
VRLRAYTACLHDKTFEETWTSCCPRPVVEVWGGFIPAPHPPSTPARLRVRSRGLDEALRGPWSGADGPELQRQPGQAVARGRFEACRRPAQDDPPRRPAGHHVCRHDVGCPGSDPGSHAPILVLAPGTGSTWTSFSTTGIWQCRSGRRWMHSLCLRPLRSPLKCTEQPGLQPDHAQTACRTHQLEQHRRRTGPEPLDVAGHGRARGRPLPRPSCSTPQPGTSRCSRA